MVRNLFLRVTTQLVTIVYVTKTSTIPHPSRKITIAKNWTVAYNCMTWINLKVVAYLFISKTENVAQLALDAVSFVV